MNGPMGLGMDSTGRIYASNFVVSTVTVYSLQVPQTITFPALPDTAFSAAPPVPTATASSGLPVSYSSLTPTVCTTSAGGAIAFIAAGPCTIAANQSGNATWTAAPQVTRTFQITPAKQHQEPTTACVRNPTVGRIPVAGTFSLMTEPCATNAGQRVGVTVSAQLRGDARYFSLYCKVSPTKATATRRTGYPDRSVYCPRGTLKIRTYGYHLRIRVRWHAPATASFTAYLQQRNYRT
jgi:hypothetical protein